MEGDEAGHRISLKAFALLRQGKINLHLVRVGHPLALQVDLSFIGYQFL